MGANRKLQIEIDRTLKKVAEGIEVFDEIWEKVYETDQLPLKEKYEADLKKEIKKLQRYRDTIKTWISGSDIKDKSTLIEARKSVERQMERFKVCEKETKTKMFSKEGLAQAQKQDPREKARNEMREWINTTVDQLTAEVENFDAEVESLQPNKKKGKPPPRLVHAEESASRHRAHIQRLEQLLRLLDNEAIDADDIVDAREQVDDYMLRNQDDFDEFSSPDDLYAELIDQLDNLEAQQPVAVSHIGKGTGAKDKDNKEREKEREKERNAALAMKMQLAQGGLHVIMEDSSPEKSLPPVTKKPSEPLGRSVPTTPTARAVATSSTREKDAAVSETASDAQSTAAESAPSTPGRTAVQPVHHDPSTSAPQQVSEEQRQAQGMALPAPGAPTPALPAGTPSFAAAAASAPIGAQRSQAPGENTFETMVQGRAQSEQALDQRKRLQRGTQPVIAGIPPGQPLPPPPQFSAAAAAASGQPQQGEVLQQGALGFQIGRPAAEGQEATASSGPVSPQPDSAKRAAGLAGKGQPQSTMAELPPEMRGPAGSTATAPIGNPATNLKLLQACATRSLPQAPDRQWGVKSIRTRLLPNGLPTSYPETKLPILDNPALFEKLETEALFFAFYYQPDTYQQYLAARELKRQSWRYHKQHGAWFQRHEEPKTATEEYEQGTYVYFDYNIMHDDLQSGWCYRLKQDFTFRYDALEDELQV